MNAYNLVIERTNFSFVVIKGKVLDKDRIVDVHINRSGGGYNTQTKSYDPVNVSSSTTITETIFIADESGQEFSINYKDWPLQYRVDNNVMMMTVTEGSFKPLVVAFKNIDTNKKTLHRSNLADVTGEAKMGAVYFLGIVMLLLAFGCYIYFPAVVDAWFNGSEAVTLAKQIVNTGFPVLLALYIYFVIRQSGWVRRHKKVYEAVTAEIKKHMA